MNGLLKVAYHYLLWMLTWTLVAVAEEPGQISHVGETLVECKTALVVTNIGSPPRVQMITRPNGILGVWSCDASSKTNWVWRTNLVADASGFGEVSIAGISNPETLFLLTATNGAKIYSLVPQYTSAAKFAARLAARPSTPFISLINTNEYLRNPTSALQTKMDIAAQVEERVRANPAVTNWIYEDRDNLFRMLDDFRARAIERAQLLVSSPAPGGYCNPSNCEIHVLEMSAAWEAYLIRHARAGRTNWTQIREWEQAHPSPHMPETNAPTSDEERLQSAIKRIKAAWPVATNTAPR